MTLSFAHPLPSYRSYRDIKSIIWVIFNPMFWFFKNIESCFKNDRKHFWLYMKRAFTSIARIEMWKYDNKTQVLIDIYGFQVYFLNR